MGAVSGLWVPDTHMKIITGRLFNADDILKTFIHKCKLFPKVTDFDTMFFSSPTPQLAFEGLKTSSSQVSDAHFAFMPAGVPFSLYKITGEKNMQESLFSSQRRQSFSNPEGDRRTAFN